MGETGLKPQLLLAFRRVVQIRDDAALIPGTRSR